MKKTKGLFKALASITVMAMLSSIVAVPTSAEGENDITFELNSTQTTYGYKVWGGVSTGQNEVGSSYAIMKENSGGACIAYGDCTANGMPGQKIVIPQGKYEVYVNAGTTVEHSWVLLNMGQSFTSDVHPASGAYATYADEHIGTLTTAGFTGDNFTLKYIVADQYKNQGAWVKYVKLVSVPDDNIYINTTSGNGTYGYRGWSGSKVEAASTKLMAAESNGALNFGDCSAISGGTAGSKITIPKGNYNVYVSAASVREHYFTLKNIGTVLTSETMPASGSYTTFKEEYVGSYKSTGDTYNYLELKGYIPASKYDSTYVKYIRFEKVVINFEGAVVNLENETEIQGDYAVDGEELELGEGNISLNEKTGFADYSVSSADGGRYELYADITATGAFSNTIEVNDNRQPSMALNEKSGLNYFGYVDLTAGENCVRIIQDMGSTTINKLVFKYVSPVPQNADLLHFAGSAASQVAGNATLNAADGTVSMNGGTSSTKALYTGTFKGGEYEVYANIGTASETRRGMICVSHISSDAAKDTEMNATYNTILDYTGGIDKYQNVYLGKYSIASGEKTIRFSDYQEKSAYIFGGGSYAIKDIYFVKTYDTNTSDINNAITFVTNEFADQTNLALGESVNYTINVSEDGLYNLDMLYGAENEVAKDLSTTGINNPAIEISVNGQVIKTHQMVSPNRKDFASLRSTIGDVMLKQGNNVIGVKNVTQNTPDSSIIQYSAWEVCSATLFIRQINAKKISSSMYIYSINGEAIGIDDEYSVASISGGIGAEFLVKLDLNGVLSDKPMSLITAVYDENGVLIWVDIDDYNITGNRTITKCIPSEVTSDDGIEYNVKMMLWDSLQTIKPYDTPKSF